MDEAFWQGLANATGGTVLPCDGSNRVIRPTDQLPPRDPERDQREIDARMRSPKRSSADQDDAGHLPLFVAANEPRLL